MLSQNRSFPSDLPRTPLGALAGGAFIRVAEAAESHGNKVRLLRDSAESYPAWLDAIAGASHNVLLENYIIQEDTAGESFAAALIAAARRGVRCRVLYDWLGCRARTSRYFWERLRQGGVEVRCYNPPRAGSPLGWISRDHRKVLCVDGEIGFAGGLCIGHDWQGDPARGIEPWRDTAVEIRGPAVADLEAAFADSWNATGSPMPVAERVVTGDIAAAGALGVWVIAGRPETMGLYRLEQLVAEIAQRTLWISDAYFVATTGYARALTGAAQAGVDVRILVPGVTNIPVVGSFSRAGYPGLLEAGVRVFEWNGPMMHAKTAVADGCWSRVGSSNSNLASWISNRELDVTIYDQDFAAQMESGFRQDLENATEIVLSRGRLVPRQTSNQDADRRFRRRTGSAGRLLAGTVGLGSTVGAAVTQHRAVGPEEAFVLAIASSVLGLLAVAALICPRVIAYPIAIVAAWLAYTLLVRAWRLKRRAAANRKSGGA